MDPNGLPAPGPEARLREMTRQDVAGVVTAHLLAFPEGFFAKLGRPFLTRYYETFLDAPFAVALMAEDDGRAVGYLVGTVHPQEHRRSLLRDHGFGLAFHGTVGLLVRPALLLRFMATRSKRYLFALVRSAAPPATTAKTRSAVLSHVVVVPQQRRTGTGRCLVNAFLDSAQRAGCTTACLVTLEGERGAADFYTAMGWALVRKRQDSEGRRLLYFERGLTP